MTNIFKIIIINITYNLQIIITTNMNQHIISVFEELIQNVQASSEPNKQFKIRSYRKVIQSIKSLPEDLKLNNDTLNIDLSTIKGIGPKKVSKLTPYITL